MPLSNALLLSPDQDALACVHGYHERTKHQLQRYAPGPETLDWEAQPAPFRRFVGAEQLPLPRLSDAEQNVRRALERPLGELPDGTALPFSLASLGALFALSLGVTAWKRQGPDRWAVRANPSSGNLHPVEGYALVSGAAFLEAGVYHYLAEDHALERRARWHDENATSARVFIALSTVMWREAWKYGERAFRYCQLDTGHAVAAIGYAAAILGWRVREQTQVGWETLRQTLGLSRAQDFAEVRRPETESEEPEVLLELLRDNRLGPVEPAELSRLSASARFSGRASTIDAHPMYSWPLIQEVAAATRWPDSAVSIDEAMGTRALPTITTRGTLASASTLILGRRSAQRFDGRFVLGRSSFVELLSAVAPSAMAPARAALDLVLLVHRVESLAPGVYLFPRSSDPRASLVSWLTPRFELRRVVAFGESLELFEIASASPRELARTARTLHCHQDIAANCCFAVAMMTDLECALREPSSYRRLLREAGSVGQTLYLQAEAAGVRGTGIGCFFDDAVAEFIGLGRSPVRSLYHFSIGKPLDDPRIETSRATAFGDWSQDP